MRIFALLLTILSLNATAYTSLSDWTVCQGEVCKEVKAGDDLYLKHGFKKEAVTYSAQFKKSQLSCFSKSDCWIFLGSVGDSAMIKLNNEIIGKFEGFIHHQSLKLSVPNSLIHDQNKIEITITDLNQTRFGLRSSEVGVGLSEEVTKLTTKDWLLRTGSTLLSAFTLFVLLLGMIATYGIYKNKKIIPLVGLTGIALLYLTSFSEIPRAYFDPVFMSGPVHFVLRLALDLTILLVALSLYRPHQTISFLSKLPSLYLIAIGFMVSAALFGVNKYAFYKTTMLIVAPLVCGGGLSLVILSYYYYEEKERQVVLPLFLGLLLLQIYDLFVFWEMIQGSFTVKWYLPFLVISFSWIYVRRRIFEVRTLKIDALIGDEVRKIAHDIAAPINNLKSLSRLHEHDLISRNIKDLENLTTHILGKYRLKSNDQTSDQDNLHVVLMELKQKYKAQININFELSPEFDWYYLDRTLFLRTFINLVTNSIKASATTLTINGYFNKGYLVIDISDDGCGIPKHLQPYIFDKEITSNKEKGNGLGLCLVKEKLRESGFEIHLKQTSSFGTIFQVSIPLDEIVLIDDNSLVRDTWTALASNIGIKIKTFENSSAVGAKEIKSTTPIFVDMNLGKEDGLRLATSLLDRGYTNIIISTGSRDSLPGKFRYWSKNFPIWN